MQIKTKKKVIAFLKEQSKTKKMSGATYLNPPAAAWSVVSCMAGNQAVWARIEQVGQAA